MINFRTFLRTVVIIIAVAGISYGFARHTSIMQPPFKITDTNHPNFDPYKFKVEDYSQHYEDQIKDGKKFRASDLYIALEEILHPELSMNEVDKILINSAGMKKEFVKVVPTAKDYYRYKYRRWYHMLFSIIALHPDPADGRNIYVWYDEKGKLLKFRLK